MRVVVVSDTHGRHRDLVVPDGDLLIHAGDTTNRGEFHIVKDFNKWLGELPHQHKVVIAGNHDFCFERQPDFSQSLLTNATYLQDAQTEIDGIRIWGSPWQPWFHDWAFNLQRGSEIDGVWQQIPNDTDILVTHGPPHGILDSNQQGESTGCKDLLRHVQRIKPKLHVFGHIHESYGRTEVGITEYVNACNCNLRYQLINPAVTVEI